MNMEASEVEAGPELDALVAEKVMGCRVVHCRDGTYKLRVPGSYDRVDFVTAEGARSACPKYSTDIAAAWEVMEKMAKEGYKPCVGMNGHCWDATMRVDIATTTEDEWMSANTAPLAICRAALAAVESKVTIIGGSRKRVLCL